MVVVPVAALVAAAGVSVAVVHAAVVAHIPAPEAAEERIVVVAVAPVRRRPQRSAVRSHNPRSWNPVVAAVRRVVPVAGRPNVAVAGNLWLLVLRQRRRRLVGIHLRLLVVAGVVVVRVVVVRRLLRIVLTTLLRLVLVARPRHTASRRALRVHRPRLCGSGLHRRRLRAIQRRQIGVRRPGVRVLVHRRSIVVLASRGAKHSQRERKGEKGRFQEAHWRKNPHLFRCQKRLPWARFA